ncbi:retinol dehydrogenase 16-like [Antedon mediterranea]|uniref:retinol dehydrogenase 16-like n=1 Tax=Antedon mediterranea TaxID=105859 RepID=UPI003AF5EE4B
MGVDKRNILMQKLDHERVIYWTACACITFCTLYTIYWLRNQFFIARRGKYVLITGCDTGFGNKLARALDKQECHVFAMCFTEDGMQKLNADTSERLHCIQLDVRKHDSVLKAYDEVKRILPAHKGLWGLVNNAGITGLVGMYDWWTKEELQNVFDVHLLGAIDVTNTFLPLVKKAKGRVVNMCSSLGINPIPSGGYGIAKLGLMVFSDGLRITLKKHGVSIHIIEPGYFRTFVADAKRNILPSMKKAWDRLSTEEKDAYGPDYVEEYSNKVEDAMKLLCSPRLHYVTDDIQHALFARWPYNRYAPGIDAKLVWQPLQYFPSFITDKLFETFNPIPKCAKE